MCASAVVIIGAGGFGREVLDIFEAQNRMNRLWNILGFVDDNPHLRNKKVRGYPVLGGIDWFSKSNDRKATAVIAIGNNMIRKAVAEEIMRLGLGFCKIIHPSTIMGDHIELDEGTMIAAGCIFTNNIKIQRQVIINLDVTVGHDTIIEDHVNLNPGVHINGNNRIREGAYIGSGAVTIQDIEIGEWSTIGAGAVVIEDVPDRSVAVGVPAKVIKTVKE